MADFTFHDISYAQGLYNMDTDASPVVEMKVSGFYYGSKQPYLDVQAARNYANAIRLGKIPLLYHFAGGADPVAEANYFINVACSPLADGDVYELDYELNDTMAPPADPDSWCRAFADRVKELTGKYPLFYIYTSLFLQHNKFPKTMEVCSLMIADYRYTPDQTVPCGHPYIIHQYTDAPIDTNASFISLDVLRKYARNTVPTPPSTAVVLPTPNPATSPPSSIPTPTPAPLPPTATNIDGVKPSVTPTPSPIPPPVVSQPPPASLPPGTVIVPTVPPPPSGAAASASQWPVAFNSWYDRLRHYSDTHTKQLAAGFTTYTIVMPIMFGTSKWVTGSIGILGFLLTGSVVNLYAKTYS